MATREEWLMVAVEKLRPWFAEQEYTVPANVRVSCGWPSKSALARKSRRIGECWTFEASAAGQFEIFISPALDDSSRVLDVLIHELVHATVGLQAGHKAPFKRCATAMGLEGKMTATVAGEALKVRLNKLIEEVGKYPHGQLDKMTNGEKKQGTRLLKVVCPDCGYTCRITQKWLDRGVPTCPEGTEMQLEA